MLAGGGAWECSCGKGGGELTGEVGMDVLFEGEIGEAKTGFLVRYNFLESNRSLFDMKTVGRPFLERALFTRDR